MPPDHRNKLSVPGQWDLIPAPAIDSAFGGGVSAALAEKPEGTWSGPARSGPGLHPVEVTEARPGGPAPIGQIRGYVARQYDCYAVIHAQGRMFRERAGRDEIRIEAEGVPGALRAEYRRP